MKIEMGKEYVTRDGREWRTYAVDGAGVYPVHGAVKNRDGFGVCARTAGGRLMPDGTDHPGDLILKRPQKWFINVYKVGGVSLHPSRGAADAAASAHEFTERLACVEVEEGQGL